MFNSTLKSIMRTLNDAVTVKSLFYSLLRNVSFASLITDLSRFTGLGVKKFIARVASTLSSQAFDDNGRG